MSTPSSESLIRLVRMTFRPEARASFLERFDLSAPRIRAFEGCRRLELWHGRRFPNVCTTFSLWTDDEALERYRQSALFRQTWQKVKPLFAAAPVAHSHTVLRSADAIEASPKERQAT